MDYKYYCEHQATCNMMMMVMMFTYLMMSKLIYLLMGCERFNELPELEQV